MEFLSRNNVEFTAKNVFEDPETIKEMLSMGSRATPTTVIDGEVIIGTGRGYPRSSGSREGRARKEEAKR